MNLVLSIDIVLEDRKKFSYSEISDPKLISHYTLPRMKAYADKVGAEFLVIKDLMGYDDPCFVKFEIGKLLEKYDRVLFLDCDVMVDIDTPNLFDTVPEDKLGVYMESDDVSERLEQTEHIWNFNKLENDGCKQMFNAGVMLLSQCHKDIIRPLPEHVTAKDLFRFREQIWFNYIFRDVDMHRLDHRWNHMDLSQQPEDGVYFRHYAAGDRKKLLNIIKEIENGN